LRPLRLCVNGFYEACQYTENNFTQRRKGRKEHQKTGCSDIRPALTIVQVLRFIDPSWLVEIEADAVINNV